MNNIISQIKQILAKHGVMNVYSEFDGRPICRKDRFTVFVGIKEYEALQPVYTDNNIFMPFRVNCTIKITAPLNCSIDELYDYYINRVEDAVDELTGMNTRLRKLSVLQDKNIDRLVLDAELRLGGIRTIPRGEDDQ